MKVVNLRKENYTHYIGRGSIFGNPFKIGVDGTREEVVKKYEDYLTYTYTFAPLWKAIYNLPEDAILGCFCKPLPCHGDVIIKVWKELHKK